jgi:hypothetical protein
MENDRKLLVGDTRPNKYRIFQRTELKVPKVNRVILDILSLPRDAKGCQGKATKRWSNGGATFHVPWNSLSS